MHPARLAALGLLLAPVLLAARTFTVVAYNVENLFDLDGQAQFEEYQPDRYTPAHALTKLRNIARVLARHDDGRGADVLLLCELEVDATPAPRPADPEALLRRHAGTTLAEMLGPKLDAAIRDLPSEVLLLKALAEAGMTGYHVVTGEAPVAAGSGRKLGQKCAILSRFPIRSSRVHPTLDARAIVEAELDVDGHPLHVFANHWKSGASDPETERTRAANARTLRNRLDELLRADPQADIVIGGDLNSNYHQGRNPRLGTTGLNHVLGSQGDEAAAAEGRRDLYNLWYELPPAQRGSDTFRGQWGTLIHLIVSRGLYDFRGVQYVDNSFAVGKFSGLNVTPGGLPLRWSFAGPAGSGFSDHFPVSARFRTVEDGRTDRKLTLVNPSKEDPAAAPGTRVDYATVDLAQVAIRPESLPARVDLREEARKGGIFRVEGRIAPGGRLAIEFRGQTYDVWSHDAALRERLRASLRAGDTFRFYGELGTYRDRWQFVIQHPSWVQ